MGGWKVKTRSNLEGSLSRLLGSVCSSFSIVDDEFQKGEFSILKRDIAVAISVLGPLTVSGRGSFRRCASSSPLRQCSLRRMHGNVGIQGWFMLV
jgi:hypothetical protein